MRLAAFAGLWEVERRIDDRRAGRAGRFTGTARFAPAAGGLAYVEEGELAFEGAAPMAATRAYHWREAAGRISLSFADGRPFHSFDAEAPAPEAAHDCPPDAYRVRYDFTAWPVWTAEWRVTGPRKDYAMTTVFRPAGQGRGIGA